MKIISNDLKVVKPFASNTSRPQITDELKIDWQVSISNEASTTKYNLGVFLFVAVLSKYSQVVLMDCEIATRHNIEHEEIPDFESLQLLVHSSAKLLPAKYNSVKPWFLPPLPEFALSSPSELDELLQNSITELSLKSRM